MNQTRIDIGMRLALDTESYATVGKLMDAIDRTVREALQAQGVERAAFDFTHFNTHPCKAMAMSRVLEHEIPYPDANGGALAELPPVAPPF